MRKVIKLTKEVYTNSNCTVYHASKIKCPTHFLLFMASVLSHYSPSTR